MRCLAELSAAKLVSYGGRLKPLTALSPWMTVLLADLVLSRNCIFRY